MKDNIVSKPQCDLIVNHEHLSLVSLSEMGHCLVKFSERSVRAQNRLQNYLFLSCNLLVLSTHILQDSLSEYTESHRKDHLKVVFPLAQVCLL